MGYTHYYSQQRDATDSEWDNITATFRTMLRMHPQPIQLESDERKPVRINKDQIWFNGIEDDGHETMVLYKDERGFKFCKTARKPYDRAVIALLLFANHFAPGAWEISSDGTEGEWQEVVDWLTSKELGTYAIPERVKKGN